MTRSSFPSLHLDFLWNSSRLSIIGNTDGVSVQLDLRRLSSSLDSANFGVLLVLSDLLLNLLSLKLLLILIIRSIIVKLVGEEETVSNPQDSEQPEQVKTLKAGEEGRRDPVRKRTLVLLSLPNNAVWADGLEFVPLSKKDAEVDVVTEVDPDDDEDAEVWADEWVVDVVECLRSLYSVSAALSPSFHSMTYSKEEIRDIVGDIHRKSHVREVEAVRRPNQGNRNNVVSHKLLKVLPGLLHSKHKHDSLLRPICSLKQIIELKIRIQRFMRIILKHARHVKIPHWCMAHNPES